jgi:hypothetical protein
VGVRGSTDLGRLYGWAIAACRRRNAPAVRRVVMELIGRLDFHHEAAARRLARLYVEALGRARRGRFRRTLRVFRALRAAVMGGDGPR